MAQLTDAEIERAVRRGARASRNEPRAVRVVYDAASAEVLISLQNGCRISFPAPLVQELRNVPADALLSVEVVGTGTGIHFPALDVDLSVEGLMLGLFGTRTAAARLAGMATSPAKANASRQNGRKGGRPKKS